MVRGSYVKGTTFVRVSLFRSEDGVRKDAIESLTCPYQGTMSTLFFLARGKFRSPIKTNCSLYARVYTEFLPTNLFVSICSG